MKFTISYIALLLLPIVNIAQYSKAPIAYTSKDSTTSLTIYDLKLSNLNYRSMLYWYDTSKQIDSLYQLEKMKTHFYAKITGIQAKDYETLQQIYLNKSSIEATIDAEKDAQIIDLKKRNKRLVFLNTLTTICASAVIGYTIYWTLIPHP